MTNQELAMRLAEMFHSFIGSEQEELLEDGLFVESICAENGIETEHLTDRDWEEVWDLFDVEVEKIKEENARLDKIRKQELEKSNREREWVEDRVRKLGNYPAVYATFMDGEWHIKAGGKRRLRHMIYDPKTDRIIK
ncbi:MAG: hypothetical protein IRZ03_18800 [Acidobacterium ailaaui]|nr:hypothetical protein [Pseudacidobacterium ailaaui]